MRLIKNAVIGIIAAVAGYFISLVCDALLHDDDSIWDQEYKALVDHGA